MGERHGGKSASPRSLSHVYTHAHTDIPPDWFSFSPNLQGCNLAYVPAMAGRVNRWRRGWCEWLHMQQGRGSTFCHHLGTYLSLISPRATADFWVMLMKSWDWLITQLSRSAWAPPALSPAAALSLRWKKSWAIRAANVMLMQRFNWERQAGWCRRSAFPLTFFFW